MLALEDCELMIVPYNAVSVEPDILELDIVRGYDAGAELEQLIGERCFMRVKNGVCFLIVVSIGI